MYSCYHGNHVLLEGSGMTYFPLVTAHTYNYNSMHVYSQVQNHIKAKGVAYLLMKPSSVVLPSQIETNTHYIHVEMLYYDLNRFLTH